MFSTRLSAAGIEGGIQDAIDHDGCGRSEAQEGGERERAPAKGAMVSDNPMKPVDLVGKRGRAPAKGVDDSEVPTLSLDSTHGGGNKDTLGSGKGKRERVSAEEAKDSDDLSTSLDEDAMDTLKHWLGNTSGHPWRECRNRIFPSNRLITRAGWATVTWPP